MVFFSLPERFGPENALEEDVQDRPKQNSKKSTLKKHQSQHSHSAQVEFSLMTWKDFQRGLNTLRAKNVTLVPPTRSKNEGS